MKLDYLRISLTDRCDFNCIYCRPRERVQLLQREKILRFEEIMEFIKLMLPWGLKRVRLTGGEPLVRKNAVELVSMIAKINQIEDITLTTNGSLLEKFAKDLKNAGLSRVNISLDTLNRKRFVQITGCDKLPEVLRGIKSAQDVGLGPVKINIVTLKGINDTEIVDFIDFVHKNVLIPRFIEYMPLNNVGLKHWYVSNEVIKKIIEEKWGKLKLVSFSGGGPAEYYTTKETSFILGFISPISKSFCHKCSRLRLSAEGKLKPCLVSDYELDVRKALRDKDYAQIKKLINLAKHYKINRRTSLPNFNNPGRFMFQIGG